MPVDANGVPYGHGRVLEAMGRDLGVRERVVYPGTRRERFGVMDARKERLRRERGAAWVLRGGRGPW